MKTSTLKPTSFQFSQLVRALPKRASLVGILLALAVAVATASAASIYKANNTEDLDLAGSWTNDVVPGPSDMAVWDSIVSAANSTVLGYNLGWGGLQILNPGGAVTIGATATNANAGATLTLGAGGIDMSAASQSLTLNVPVTLLGSTVQSWKVGNEQTLALKGPLTHSAGEQLRFDISSGKINISISSISSVILGGATNRALYYSLLNGTDVGDVDNSGNVVPAATVMAAEGLYYTNVAGGDVFGGNSLTNDSESAGAYLDMVNGNPSGDDVDFGGVRYLGFVRFNTPEPYRNYWVYNVGSVANETFHPGSTYLMTTNVGAQDVVIEGKYHAFRWNDLGGNDELILDQEDPAGTMYVNGGTSERHGNGILTKTGAGRVVWNANVACTGPIYILGGELMFNNSAQASSVMTVASGGTLAGATTIPGPVIVNGGAIHPGSTNGLGTLNLANLTLNAGSSLIFYSALVPTANTTPLLNLTGVLTVNGPVNVAIASGTPVLGQYPLLQWINPIPSATFADFNLAVMPLRREGYLTNDTANDSIDLVITNVNEPIRWAVGNGMWDTQTANWVDQMGVSTAYMQTNESGVVLSESVLFNDTALGTSPITISLNNTMTPVATTVSNTTKEYIFAGPAAIGGEGALTKSGPGMLVLQSSNAFTGGINLNGGVVDFSSLPELGAGAINFGGGALQFASGNTNDISVRTVTFNAEGGTIDDGDNTLTFANPVGGGGTGGLTLTGGASLTLNGTNDYYGDTVVNQGTLALGANTYLPDSAAFIVNSGAVLNTATSGVGLSLNGAVNQMLAGTGTVDGDVTAPTSTTISPAANGVAGTLTINGALTVSGGTLAMDVSSSAHDLIIVTNGLALNSGTVQLNVSGALPPGAYPLIQYSGALSGAAANLTLGGFSQTGESAYLDDSVAGQINLVVSTTANDNLTWSGSGNSWDLLNTRDWLNGTQPWAFTNGDTVTFDDSASTNSTVELQGFLQPALVTVSNSAIPTYTFADNGGKLSGPAALVKEGTGTLVMETANTYTGPTTIQSGTLQIGSGAGGDIGRGAITNNGVLLFEQGDGTNHFVDGVVSGTGSLTVDGSATVILANNNAYSGTTTISNGTLQVGEGGSVGSLGSNTAVTDNGTLAVDKSGALSFPYNISGSGALVNSGSGTVSLTGNLTYQGNTSINGGVVKITANNRLPSGATAVGSTGVLNVDGGASSGGVLDLNGFNQTVNALSGAVGTVSGVITNSSTAASTTNVLTVLNTVSTTNNDLIMNGATGARTELLVTGAGTLTLNPPTNSTFSGGMVISNSTVVLGTPAGMTKVNIYESQLAPGTGPITLLGSNATLYVAGTIHSSTGPTYPPLTNTVILPAGQVATVYGSQRGDNDMTLVGSGTINYISPYVRGNINNWSGFTGLANLTGINGGYLGLNDATGLENAHVNITSNLVLYARVGGTPDVYIGQLTGGDASDIIESTSSGNGGGRNAIFAIGGLNTDSSYGGHIIDGNGLLKVGTGTFTLDGGSQPTTNISVLSSGSGDITNVSYGTNMLLYTGPTTVSNGVLALVVPSELTHSTSVILASPTAVLDASAMGYISNQVTSTSTNQFPVTNSLFEVVSGRTLQGIGTLKGNLLADAGSTFNVGLPLGSFTVTSNTELAGTVTLNVNATNSPNRSELIAPSITVDSGARLVVANLGPEVATKFQLFNQAINTNGVTIDLPTLSGTNSWIDNLAVNGSITMVAPPPTPTITHFGVSGTMLSITAANGAANGRFELLESTNLATPLINWVPVLTSTFDANGSLNLSINIINPATPQEFYILLQ